MSDPSLDTSGQNHGPHHEPKMVTMIVNGKRKMVPKHAKLTFNDVVALAFATPPTGEGVQISIQYTRAHGHKPAGTLVEGQSVEVNDGTEFDVTATNRS